jgi:hypothetical protein
MSGEESAPESAPGKLDVFTYVTVEHASLYRAIVDVFVEAKLRYRIQLRVDEVMSALRAQRLLVSHDEAGVTTYLDQLRKWGNLKRTQDTRDVATLSEFYHRRSLYQLTTRGEEAHRGVVAVERLLASSGGRLSSSCCPPSPNDSRRSSASSGLPSPTRRGSTYACVSCTASRPTSPTTHAAS